MANDNKSDAVASAADALGNKIEPRRRQHFRKSREARPDIGNGSGGKTSFKVQRQPNRAVLEEIRDNWKLEAKSESSQRYFFHVGEVQLIESGKKSYIIGRKGTGKTAITEYFYTKSSYS